MLQMCLICVIDIFKYNMPLLFFPMILNKGDKFFYSFT